MDFRSLEVLIWLVKDPNLNRTAERLKVSQPTLTKRLANLESDIGLQLFERRGVLGMVPTAHAIELAETARRLLDNWSYATNLSKMKDKEKPYLNMSGPSLFMQFVIAPLWAKSKLPSQYLIHYQTSPVIDIGLNLSGKETDAAFLFDKSKALDFKFMPVCTEHLAVIYNADCPAPTKNILEKENDGLLWLSYRPDRDPLSLMIQSEILPKKQIAGFFEDLAALLNVICGNPRFATVLPLHAVLYNKDKLRGLPLNGTENPIYFVYRAEGEKQAALKEFGEFVVNELDCDFFANGKK